MLYENVIRPDTRYIMHVNSIKIYNITYTVPVISGLRYVVNDIDQLPNRNPVTAHGNRVENIRSGLEEQIDVRPEIDG